MSEQIENKFEFNTLGYNGTERIYLNELKVELNYSTTNSIKEWCKRHRINVLKDGQKRFIYRYDWDRVNISIQIKDLQMRYKEKWEYAFELAQRNELYRIEEVTEPKSFHNIPRYIPRSNAAKKLLDV